MDDSTNLDPPAAIAQIERATAELGFRMSSSPRTGSLLRTLAASKPAGRILELGTGTGLSTAWLLDGLSSAGKLDSVDNDQDAQQIARNYLGDDPRLSLHAMDGDAFIHSLAAAGRRFEFIFADTWPGKLRLLDETLGLVERCGFYVVDDMLPQSNWSDLDYDHSVAIKQLARTLEKHPDLHVAKLGWDTGLLIAVKK